MHTKEDLPLVDGAIVGPFPNTFVASIETLIPVGGGHNDVSASNVWLHCPLKQDDTGIETEL